MTSYDYSPWSEGHLALFHTHRHQDHRWIRVQGSEVSRHAGSLDVSSSSRIAERMVQVRSSRRFAAVAVTAGALCLGQASTAEALVAVPTLETVYNAYANFYRVDINYTSSQNRYFQSGSIRSYSGGPWYLQGKVVLRDNPDENCGRVSSTTYDGPANGTCDTLNFSSSIIQGMQFRVCRSRTGPDACGGWSATDTQFERV